MTNIQVCQEFVPWSNVSLTNIFVKWLSFNNGFDQDILVKCLPKSAQSVDQVLTKIRLRFLDQSCEWYFWHPTLAQFPRRHSTLGTKGKIKSTLDILRIHLMIYSPEWDPILDIQILKSTLDIAKIFRSTSDILTPLHGPFNGTKNPHFILHLQMLPGKSSAIQSWFLDMMCVNFLVDRISAPPGCAAIF